MPGTFFENRRIGGPLLLIGIRKCPFQKCRLSVTKVNMGKTKKYREHLLKSLQDPEEAAAYLNACMEDEDPHVFLLALKDVTDAQGGMSKLSRNTSLNRQSLYRTFSNTGNPKLQSIRYVLSSLGMDLHITAHHK